MCPPSSHSASSTSDCATSGKEGGIYVVYGSLSLMVSDGKHCVNGDCVLVHGGGPRQREDWNIECELELRWLRASGEVSVVGKARSFNGTWHVVESSAQRLSVWKLSRHRVFFIHTPLL